jgi:hypothetical protein
MGKFSEGLCEIDTEIVEEYLRKKQVYSKRLGRGAVVRGVLLAAASLLLSICMVAFIPLLFVNADKTVPVKYTVYSKKVELMGRVPPLEKHMKFKHYSDWGFVGDPELRCRDLVRKRVRVFDEEFEMFSATFNIETQQYIGEDIYGNEFSLSRDGRVERFVRNVENAPEYIFPYRETPISEQEAEGAARELLREMAGEDYEKCARVINIIRNPREGHFDFEGRGLYYIVIFDCGDIDGCNLSSRSSVCLNGRGEVIEFNIAPSATRVIPEDVPSDFSAEAIESIVYEARLRDDVEFKYDYKQIIRMNGYLVANCQISNNSKECEIIAELVIPLE